MQQRSQQPIANRRRRSAGGLERLAAWAAGAVAVILIGLVVQARLVAHAALPAPNGKHSLAAASKPPPGSFLLKVSDPDLPAGIEPGTCVEFNPTGPDRHHTVYVDPGHGGSDPGAVGGGLQEKDVTLAVGLRLKDLLRADGFHVVISRLTDTSVAKLAGNQVVNGAITNSGVHIDTIARIACGEAGRAEALVGLHFNGYSDPSASGSEVFYDDVRTFTADNLRLATQLHDALMASLAGAGWQVYDRGVLSDADTGASGLTATADAYGRLMEIGPGQKDWNNHPSSMPGAIVEPLFLTAPNEAAVAGSADGQKAIAVGLERGTVAFFTPAPAASPSPRG